MLNKKDISPKGGLLIIDVQNDFCSGGSLPVKDGEKVVPVLNRYIDIFTALNLPVFATRDWHPPVTMHFKKYGGLWPPHCIQGTWGAEFHPGLALPKNAVVVSAGADPGTQGYSGFEGMDETGAGLKQILEEAGVAHLYIGGLATDYCVSVTALEALKEGFRVTMLTDAMKGVDLAKGDSERALKRVLEGGAEKSTLTAEDES